MRSKANNPIPIECAKIEAVDGSILSSRFGDIYYSVAGGIEESEHVYLYGNKILERFRSGGTTVVGELGFGTGLNCLLTLRAFKESHRPGSRLIYLAYEKYPIEQAKFAEILNGFGIDRLICEEIIRGYPHPVEGLHLINLSSLPVSIYLYLGDAEDKLAETSGLVDAWYLDGFAPDKNPELWSTPILKEISRLSHSGTTFGTYTVSSAVRSSLSALGWSVQKVPGVGKKREVLTGIYASGAAKVISSSAKRVAVVGGGIAGAFAASALSRRGVEVTLFEKSGTLCGAASGNLKAAVFPYLSSERERRHRLYLTGFQYLERELERLDLAVEPEGALYLPFRERQEDFLDRVLEFQLPSGLMRRVNVSEGSELAGVPVEREGLFFPGGRALSFSKLAEVLLAGVEIRYQEFSGADLIDFDAAVLASGASIESESQLFSEELNLLLAPVLGHVGLIDADEESGALRTILCGDGYLIPDSGAGVMVGATYFRGVRETAEDPAPRLEAIANKLLSHRKRVVRGIRAGVRATTRDRMPIVGKLNFESNAVPIFGTLGHGSRGGVSAGLVGESVAAEICAEPLPIERTILSGLTPARFFRQGS